mmetsp:Transcript_8272/g.24563  ORF Transcript_8272/g.24563 Transcript_8272/m.24563 type:complete len:411 (+) Transcript_8272:35-1267(+)
MAAAGGAAAAYPTRAMRVPGAGGAATELEGDGDDYIEVGSVVDDIIKAEVVLQWNPRQAEEIALEVGDLVAIEFKDTASGWWVGTNTRTGETGIFPGSHVEEIEWTEQEAEVFQFNDELLRLADELEQFEGERGGRADSEELLFDSIATELGLLVPLALGSGFCDINSLDDETMFLFFTRQVLCAILNRSDPDSGVVVLLNGSVTAGMFHGDCGDAIGHIEQAMASLSRVPPARSQLAAEFLQAQFAAMPTESASKALGRDGALAVGDTMVEVIQSVESLARCPGLRQRWGMLVDKIRASKDPSQPTSILSSFATKVKTKASLLKSVVVSALMRRLSLGQRDGAEAEPRPDSPTKRALERAGAAANTAALLSFFKTKAHTLTIRKHDGLSEGTLIEAAKARDELAPQLAQ